MILSYLLGWYHCEQSRKLFKLQPAPWLFSISETLSGRGLVVYFNNSCPSLLDHYFTLMRCSCPAFSPPSTQNIVALNDQVRMSRFIYP